MRDRRSKGGYEDTRQVTWPCNTYAAMKEAADA